jgi:hypothetical protein
MLLQTNSYIVPKERRAEHARLIRRFRQALARIGCDQFEVYEQVGANWSPGGANGRYVQIMRFRDRQHQQAVQAAEANDPGAQQIIAEFCDLINFAYQQQHGYFATGFYTSVLPTGPRHVVERDAAETEEEPDGAGVATAGESFSSEAPTPSIDPASVADVADDVSQAPPETPGTDDLSGLDGSGSPIDGGKELAEAEAAALAVVAMAEVAAETRAEDSAPMPVVDPPDEPDRQSEAAATDPGAEFHEPDLDDLGLDFEDAPMPVETEASVTDSIARTQEVVPSNGTPHEPDPGDLDHDEPAAHVEQRLGNEAGDDAPDEALLAGEATSSDQLETIDHGLIFEDEDPAENAATPDEHAEHSVGLDATTAAGAPVRAAPPAAVLEEPHEELLPHMHDLYSPGNGHADDESTLSSASDLDALLDDANLLDNVPFPGDEAHVPRDSSTSAMAEDNGHDAPVETGGDLLEFEALFGELDQDASEHPNRAP